MDGEPLVFFEMGPRLPHCNECGVLVSGFETLPGAWQKNDDGDFVCFVTDARVLPCGHLSGVTMSPQPPTAAELRAAEGLDFS